MKKKNSYYSLQRKCNSMPRGSHQVSLILQSERLFPKFELRTSQVTRQQHHTISSRLIIIPFLSEKSDRKFNTIKPCICNTPHQEKKKTCKCNCLMKALGYHGYQLDVLRENLTIIFISRNYVS